MSESRLLRIDLMVGLMMFLVVLGHLNIDPRVPEWYMHGLLQWIYSFHMEVFIFLSGFIIRYSYKGVHSIKDYGNYIWKKFKKFFIWILVIGIAIALFNFVKQSQGNVIEYVTKSLTQLLLYPMYSEASFLWYIYVLFGFYLISPPYFRLPQWMQRALCIVALMLPILPATQFLAAERFCKYTCFYCLGVICAQGIEELKAIKTWSWALLSLPFIAFSVWMVDTHFQTQTSQMPFLGTITGFMALPFVYFVAIMIEKCKPLANIFVRIGLDCYWIYILQMFIIWSLVWLLARTPLFNSPYFFILFIPIALIFAIGLPILVKAFWRKVRQ